jgi:glyoxylase-like metal-dependent hydrolase (beta-lactamase superfamily II)
MCPIGGKLFPSVFPKKVICHCLLIESRSGLVLVDTGFADSVYKNPKSMGLLQPFFGLQHSPEDSALQQIQKLGFQPSDVRHLIPTHLDNDHAGAIDDFPTATVHASNQELQAALNPKGFVENIRYRQFRQKNSSQWKLHSITEGENWFGFQGVRALKGTDDEILLIPLFGHTRGHIGVAAKSDTKWTFHVGDSYYNRAELNLEKPQGLGLFQTIVHHNRTQALENQKRLAELIQREKDVEVFCAHDPEEFF